MTPSEDRTRERVAWLLLVMLVFCLGAIIGLSLPWKLSRYVGAVGIIVWGSLWTAAMASLGKAEARRGD